MFKLARKNYLREIFSGGSSCTGDCGQGRRCTCSGESKEMSQAPETAEKPTDSDAQNPASCINRSDIIRMAREARMPYFYGTWEIANLDGLERFANLVVAHEREAQTEQELVIDCPRCGHCCPKRPWVGLTEEEIKECFTITPDLFLPWHIYTRIEAKLKEKNA